MHKARGILEQQHGPGEKIVRRSRCLLACFSCGRSDYQGAGWFSD